MRIWEKEKWREKRKEEKMRKGQKEKRGGKRENGREGKTHWKAWPFLSLSP